MAIRRRAGPAREITPLPSGDSVFEVTLSKAPSPVWRGAFNRPPDRLLRAECSPDHLDTHGHTIAFRTTAAGLAAWLHRIDSWIDHANSVVEE